MDRGTLQRGRQVYIRAHSKGWPSLLQITHTSSFGFEHILMSTGSNLVLMTLHLTQKYLRLCIHTRNEVLPAENSLAHAPCKTCGRHLQLQKLEETIMLPYTGPQDNMLLVSLRVENVQ